VLHERKQGARSDIKEEIGEVKIVWMLGKKEEKGNVLQ